MNENGWIDQDAVLSDLDRRNEIVERTQSMIRDHFPNAGANGPDMLIQVEEFHVRLLFSRLHPLIVICLSMPLDILPDFDWSIVNTINGGALLGNHSLNMELGCFNFRSSQWLDAPYTFARFSEIISRCIEEARKSFKTLESCCK